MRLKTLEISGFKSFAKKATLGFDVPVTAIVGPNGSGKSNVAEAFRFVLGEQSVKSLRGKKGEDLIFGGGKSLARLNRASVKVVFDNAKRRLPIDFDEVSLERVVHRDGFNEYFINDSKVRLKDIAELLAHANIGSSGHHIISQGEADRILTASPVERREMVEDALGLKIYHYRKKESVKKLEKTQENIKQVESLRREIAPHLDFLRKQVEKLEKGRELKEKLEQLYIEYFKREDVYISFTRKALQDERKEPESVLKHVEGELKNIEEILSRSPEDPHKQTMLREAQGNLNDFQKEKDDLSRDLGRIEGELAFIARMQAKEQPVESAHPQTLAYHDVKKLTDEIHLLLKEAQSQSDISAAIEHMKSAEQKIKTFFDSLKHHAVETKNEEYVKDLEELSVKKEALIVRIDSLQKEVRAANDIIESIRASIEKDRHGNREAERSMYELKAKQNEAISLLAQIKLKEEKLAEIEAEFKRELGEAGALIGHKVTTYSIHEPISADGTVTTHESMATESRSMQEERKRTVERTKIRLEDAGLGTGEEVLKEYKETTERDAFLKKEVEDLYLSSDSLTKLIADLDLELKKRFDDGIIKINDKFGEFFATMFGGGEARLDVISMKKKGKESGDEDEEVAAPEMSGDDEDEAEQVGIDAYVSLPHKRVKGLVMLSGGERALTSIALLFAISQVNPPPFIILDETDAALDEANSRKYGDMITSLAKHSQLILITHNRETMSRAGVLYGVTMSSEGYSTLLSIRFEEAVKVAK